MRKLLVTGGAGFIGSNFVHYILSRYDDAVIYNLDVMTYAGHPGNLSELAGHPGHHWIQGDITDRAAVDHILREGVDAIVHFAAESHVDRSIADPWPFVRTNINGTYTLLEAARAAGISRFVHVSTDEVYGSLGPEGYFTEDSPIQPNSPYSSSKASSDLLVRAYRHTFGMNAVITRCSNNYGPRQFPEKLIPTIITRALQDQEIPVYGDGLNIRDWLYVDDHCSAIDAVLRHGAPGEVYNIGGHNEHTNIDIVKRVLAELGKPESLIRFVKDRAGHDRRYAIDPAKISRELGWAPAHSFSAGLPKTVKWYLDNEPWWRSIIDGTYQHNA